MDQKKIERGVRLILEGIGDNPDREGLRETPRRVAEMCGEIFSGLQAQPDLGSSLGEALGREDIIAVRGIDFFSVCEHHLLPFFGNANLYYLPQNNRIAGFSSISRIVDTYARRPQVQERLTCQIADEIMRSLQPRGVLVHLEATHLCASMRGSRKKDMRAVTEALRGELSLERLSQLTQTD